VVSQFPADVAERLLEIVRDAFVTGMQWGFRVDTALAFLGLFTAALSVGGTVHLRRWPDDALTLSPGSRRFAGRR
jgi:hypothetical protein